MLAKENEHQEDTPLLESNNDSNPSHHHDHDHHDHHHSNHSHDHAHKHNEQLDKQTVQQLEVRWVKIVTIFLYVTVIWAATEGGISVYGGWIHNHLSLFAFGIDSCIEVLSASLVIYHMMCKSALMQPQLSDSNSGQTQTRPRRWKSVLFNLETERRLTLFIGFLLICFCIFAGIGGIYRLVSGSPPDDTQWGIIIGAVCTVVMSTLYYYKTKASVILASPTLQSDAACSFGCAKLSAVLLIGSVCYEIWTGLWWVDGVTAIIIGLLVGHEGYETVKGAIDKDQFQGGVACCGAHESDLAKWMKKGYPHLKEHHDHHHLGSDLCQHSDDTTNSDNDDRPSVL